MNHHKLLERKQTIDQFRHILDCETCTIDSAQMCDFARKEYPSANPEDDSPLNEPIEFSMLNNSQSFAEQKAIYLRVIRESRAECHKLRLMLL